MFKKHENLMPEGYWRYIAEDFCERMGLRGLYESPDGPERVFDAITAIIQHHGLKNIQGARYLKDRRDRDYVTISPKGRW